MPFPRALTLALPLCLAAGPALAAGSLGGTAFGGGLVLPVLVIVHLLGLLAIGLWAEQQGGQEQGQIPAVALAAAAVFALIHQFGVRIPYTQLVLEGSLVVLGGLVLAGVTLPQVVGIVVAVVAGAAHGLRFGAWDPGGWLSWLGLACGAMLVVASGVGLGSLLAQAAGRMAVRAVGGAIAVVGALMLLGVL